MSGDQSAIGQLEHQLYVVLLAQMKHAMYASSRFECERDFINVTSSRIGTMIHAACNMDHAVLQCNVCG